MIGVLLKAGNKKILSGAACLIAAIAVLDWSVGNTLSLGVLYILPMMLSALVLRWPQTAGLALFCAFLRACFDVPSTGAEIVLRFVFASLSYFASGLFVIGLMRNRLLGEQLRELVARSPAAILTMDGKGNVLAANDAANSLFAIPAGQSLRGRAIVGYLPVLFDALRLQEPLEEFRTSAQCQGTRENDEIFLAHTWFSSYSTPEGPRLAAIIVDSSEEMRDREEQSLRQLQRSNRITAAAVSHELRNLCGAISLVCSQVETKHGLSSDSDFQGLAKLVKGLESLANLELHARAGEASDLQEVSLQRTLDDLRIVIESEWTEIDGHVQWRLPRNIPLVWADPNGLLQAFLNLAQNSHRAVQEGAVRELEIAVTVQGSKAVIRFQDSGPGIARPDLLFQPFQAGADGTGLGLYVSRAVVRSYGGDLRFEPQPQGACFVLELQVV